MLKFNPQTGKLDVVNRGDFISGGLLGGQTATGDTASGGNLTLLSTSHATKGKILFGTSAYDEVNNRLGIGKDNPSQALDVVGNGKFTGSIEVNDGLILKAHMIDQSYTGDSPYFFGSNGETVLYTSPVYDNYIGIPTGLTEGVEYTIICDDSNLVHVALSNSLGDNTGIFDASSIFDGWEGENDHKSTSGPMIIKFSIQQGTQVHGGRIETTWRKQAADVIYTKGNVGIGNLSSIANLLSVGSGTVGIGPNYAQSTVDTGNPGSMAVEGNLGIGTLGPSARLDVHGSGTTTGKCFELSDSVGNAKVTVLDDGATTFVNQITSSLATGTSPFSITSTTVNTNLNADLLDGKHYSDLQGEFQPIEDQRLSTTNSVEFSGLKVGFGNGISFGQAITDVVIGTITNVADYLKHYSYWGTIFEDHTGESMRIKEGKLGVGTSDPSLKTDIQALYGAPATSGTTPNGNLALTSSSVYESLYFGISSTLSGTDYPAWIQASRRNDLSAVVPLLLNPRGGNVGIGITNPGEKLEVNGNIFLTSDSQKAIFGTGKDMTIYYNGTSGYIDLNDVAASDLHIQCGTDKTVVLDETVTDDIQFKIDTNRFGVANKPTVTTLSGNLTEYTWAVNDYAVMFTEELIHEYSEGSDLRFHLHGITNGLDGTNRTVKFEIEYAIQNDAYVGNIGSVLTTPVTISKEITIPANTTDRSGVFIQFDAVSGTGLKIGAQIKVRLKRVTSSGTEPTNNIFIGQLGLHIEKDTLGSRQTGVK